jgi:signal peptidase II
MVAAFPGFLGLLLVANKIRLCQLVSFSLLSAGSMGNLIDRLFHHGLVIDILILGTNTFHTGIFNYADILITTSILMLSIEELVHKHAASPSIPAQPAK